jgi:tetratricopeptide (TPR) repeat protein
MEKAESGGASMKQWKKGTKAVAVVLVALMVSACSTPPKNTGEVFGLRSRAETQLESGNKEADRGSPDNALILLNEAWRLAVASDDPALRVRAGLSRANVLFSLGRKAEAEEGWQTALNEAESTGNRELTAVCRIHISRGKLLSQNDAAQEVIEAVRRDMAQINDTWYAAFGWTVIARAESQQERFAEAEAASKRSLAIHEASTNLELAAYDWFLIASFRSRSGDHDGAIAALEASIAIDRRIENSWGLASSWRAMGDVHKRYGENDAARTAYTRAAGIFNAIGMDEAAAEALARIGQ